MCTIDVQSLKCLVLYTSPVLQHVADPSNRS